MRPKDEMANNVDPDQTAPREQSDLDLHCLFRPVCFHYCIFTVIFIDVWKPTEISRQIILKASWSRISSNTMVLQK